MFTNWLTASAPTPNAPPPDIILEIGPLPFTRYAAHSSLIAAHSGYLRSALRLDDRNIDSPIYVPNITAEHFAPLLSYMYTGFLDLTIENIFGVLLATHVLHMPRALEICRAFLARIQSEGYLGGAFLSSSSSYMDKSLEKTRVSAIGDGVKVIRPIASKAINSGLAFISPPISKPLLPSHDTPFRSLCLSTQESDAKNRDENVGVSKKVVNATIPEKKRERSPVASTSKEDVIEFITKKKYTKLISKNKLHKRPSHKLKVQSPVIEVAILDTAQNLDDNNPDKIVIDVASCDGPVRFQRVLNDAYGRFPNQHNNSSFSSSDLANSVNERNRAHVATSFHIQMARNISERQSINAIDSENSQEIIVHEQQSDTSANQNINNNGNKNVLNGGKTDEVYNCVYCKHTFKSQYCYQKHAKRHINPLSIDGEFAVDTIDSGSERDEKSNNSLITERSDVITAISNVTAAHGPNAIKREVRPLDMNVQYYPCKTCGSKFPSYYFVHKHRKLCHANEEN